LEHVSAAPDKQPPLPLVNRRRALTALAVGVVAPGVLAACSGKENGSSQAAEAPAAPSLTYSPENAASDVNPTTPVRESDSPTTSALGTQ